jgi:hypothetical protein
VRGVFRRFTENVVAAMQLGAYNENWTRLPGERLPSEPPVPTIFSFGGLARLTTGYVADPTLQNHLLSLVRQAEQAAALGNVREKERLLAEVADVLQKVRGVVLPAVQTDALTVVAKSL